MHNILKFFGPFGLVLVVFSALSSIACGSGFLPNGIITNYNDFEDWVTTSPSCPTLDPEANPPVLQWLAVSPPSSRTIARQILTRGPSDIPPHDFKNFAVGFPTGWFTDHDYNSPDGFPVLMHLDFYPIGVSTNWDFWDDVFSKWNDTIVDYWKGGYAPFYSTNHHFVSPGNLTFWFMDDSDVYLAWKLLRERAELYASFPIWQFTPIFQAYRACYQSGDDWVYTTPYIYASYIANETGFDDSPYRDIPSSLSIPVWTPERSLHFSLTQTYITPTNFSTNIPSSARVFPFFSSNYITVSNNPLLLWSVFE